MNCYSLCQHPCQNRKLVSVLRNLPDTFRNFILASLLFSQVDLQEAKTPFCQVSFEAVSVKNRRLSSCTTLSIIYLGLSLAGCVKLTIWVVNHDLCLNVTQRLT